MNQKLNFIREWESKRYDFKSLCIAYGISRPTGYKIVKRYMEEGFDALAPRSRRPHSHPSSVSEELVSKIKKWRKEYGAATKFGTDFRSPYYIDF